MTRTRLFALRMAGIIAALAVPLAMVIPVAQADPIADIRGQVAGNRGASCPNGLNYNQTLQDIAFAVSAPIPDPPARIDGLKAQYGGEVVTFNAAGDHQAHVVNKTYQAGAGPAIGDCSMTDFGVAFIRNEAYGGDGDDDFGPDFVGIVLGKKAAAPAGGGQSGSSPAQQDVPKPDVVCNPETDESATVPAGQQCKPKAPVACPPGGPQTSVPAGQKCPPPANAVKVTFNRGFGTWGVNVKNNAGIGGSCTYTATSQNGLPGRDEAFEIAPNGTHSFDVLAPVGKYDVVTSCTGTYDGQQVEFGRDVQTVG
ncbi:MAG: hypothetical protein QOJ24_1036 [Mycobacterium sp.]|nr:hypothetical protein [Mycobacterium sp.]